MPCPVQVSALANSILTIVDKNGTDLRDDAAISGLYIAGFNCLT
jgi:hypothetical protein